MLVSLAGRHAPVSFQNLRFSDYNCFFTSILSRGYFGLQADPQPPATAKVSVRHSQLFLHSLLGMQCALRPCHLPPQSSVPCLCAPRGCPRPHRVSCFSWRLTVCSHGPVCGCWPCRFHSHHGLLSSWPICSPGSAVLVEGGYGGVPGLEWGLHWPHSSPPQNVLQCCSACSHAGASVPMTQREENSFMGCSDGGRAIW